MFGNATHPHNLKIREHLSRNICMNLKVIDIDKKNNILIVKGSIPGSNHSIVSIKDSVKKVVNHEA